MKPTEREFAILLLALIAAAIAVFCTAALIVGVISGQI